MLPAESESPHAPVVSEPRDAPEAQVGLPAAVAREASARLAWRRLEAERPAVAARVVSRVAGARPGATSAPPVAAST